MEDEGHIDYNKIVDILINAFGTVLNRDLLYSIVENFEGDLEESANAVVNIIMDENNADDEQLRNTRPDSSVDVLEPAVEEGDHAKTFNSGLNIHNTTDSANMQPALSCAETSRITNSPNVQSALSYAETSRKIIPPVHQASSARLTTSARDTSQNFRTDQIQQILSHHENGARTLIILRGLPGSGKTHLAKKIIDTIYDTTNQHYDIHILSTDDFFMHHGRYIYERFRLSEAHEWNQNRARIAITKGVSPIIIDNTNIDVWEMQYYVTQGVQNGYIIETLEPNTPWARNVKELARRNTHNVSAVTIQRKLDVFVSGISVEFILKKFQLSYSSSYIPPVLRAIPPFSKIKDNSVDENENVTVSNKISSLKEQQGNHEGTQCSSTETTIEVTASENASDKIDSLEKSLSNNITQYAELQKRLEEMEKLDREWENGDNWDDKYQNKNQNNVNSGFVNSKPQRQNKPMVTGTTEKFLASDEVCKDWRKCVMFLPSWGENSRSTQMECMPVIEKKSSSTCIEHDDANIDSPGNHLKVISAVPRDINEYHIAVNDRKIPEKWMLDKSTSTNNSNILNTTFNCPNKEQHFSVFRNFFKNKARSDLRDVFDKCSGDVNWAVNLVLQNSSTKYLDIEDSTEHSDTEAETQNDNVDLCQCLAAYDIIPDNSDLLPPITKKIIKKYENATSTSKSKDKKESMVSESSVQLKRQIEQNVVIPDNFYSQHCLKIRKLRSNEVDKTNNGKSNTQTSEAHIALNKTESSSSNLNCTPSNICTPSTSKIELCEEHSPNVNEDIEKTVNVYLGKEFISQLDNIFGRDSVDYPSNVIPEINMPMSVLNEINALWMESLMDQLKGDVKQTQMMIKQDEEFARQLLIKEAELTQQGKEPEVPDFKEIMDMDFALSLYQKDVAEWRNQVPADLAAKLTRDKLHNLFPNVPEDTLSELLMAHNNNFLETVEGLLVSTGKAEILGEENGINKFIMEKEMQRQAKLLEAEKKAIAEVEWPLLPMSENLDMSTVQQYRDDAEKHLRSRNINYQKAQEYIRRGITSAAANASEVAAYHTRMYELANSKAAVTLMQIHASNFKNNAVIDLHYLRTSEATESLDLFIDSHIHRLREMQDTSEIKFHTLYFITGRGLHSKGKPKIKPAVINRLEERGLAFSEKNPGLLTAKVCAEAKLSHEIA